MIKADMEAVFMKWRPLLEEQTGAILSELACDYGKVGIKEGRLSVVLDEQYKEADIVEQLEKRHLEQFVIHKKTLNKQLVLRSYADEFIVKALKEVGITATTKEEFYIKVK